VPAVINDTGILVVLVAVILLFGASQIPKLARNLGEAGKEFRKAHDDADSTVQSSQEQIPVSRGQLEALSVSAPPPSQAQPNPAASLTTNPTRPVAGA
jgi:sec-independent protein translocase protein TatA